MGEKQTIQAENPETDFGIGSAPIDGSLDELIEQGWRKLGRLEKIRQGDRVQYTDGLWYPSVHWKSWVGDQQAFGPQYIRFEGKPMTADTRPLPLPPGYSRLNVWEVIEKGDLYYDSYCDMWRETGSPGLAVSKSTFYIRRTDEPIVQLSGWIKCSERMPTEADGDRVWWATSDRKWVNPWDCYAKDHAEKQRYLWRPTGIDSLPEPERPKRRVARARAPFLRDEDGNPLEGSGVESKFIECLPDDPDIDACKELIEELERRFACGSVEVVMPVQEVIVWKHKIATCKRRTSDAE